MSNAVKKPHSNIICIEENLRKLSFDEFPDQLLAELSSLTEFVTLDSGTELLTQGQTNSSLFFLLTGKVGVYVDAKLVTYLARRGEVIGEMSVITNSPCGATIVAETPIEVFKVKAKEFKNLTGGQTDRFQHTLYRIYANILTDRLHVTNQKAKEFEELNVQLLATQNRLREMNQNLEELVKKRTAALEQKTKDLMKSHSRLEQKNTALLASYKKIEELYSTRDVTFEKLESLFKDHLVPLNFTLDDLVQRVDPKNREAVEQASKEVMQVMALLEPITSHYSAEMTIRSKHVLLCDTNKKQQVVAKMALGGTGCELVTTSSLEEAQDKLDESQFDIIFVDLQNIELVNSIRSNSPQSQIVFMTGDEIPQFLPELRKLEYLPNIVSRDPEDKTFSIKNIMTTVAKLSSGDIFGLEKYLAWGVDVQSAPVMSSLQRQQLINDMNKYFERVGLRRSIRDRCAAVTEELLMNAIYDAPRDKDGNPIYNSLSRREVIDLKPEHQGKIKYATDGMLMAVSVEDPFGSLSGDVILKYLESCYSDNAGSLQAEEKKGGAGRGLHQIIENSDLVVFNINPHMKTEVIAIFNVDPKAVGMKTASFHLFIQ